MPLTDIQNEYEEMTRAICSNSELLKVPSKRITYFVGDADEKGDTRIEFLHEEHRRNHHHDTAPEVGREEEVLHLPIPYQRALKDGLLV